MIIVLGAAAAWGFGSVLSHRLAVPSHAMLAAAIEMLAGGVVLLAVGAGSGEFSRIQWSSVPATSWIALAYLIGPGSILAFTAYGYALSHLPLTTVSTYAYVNPVVAVLAGIMFLGEQFTWREGLGAVLVLVSVMITLHRSRSTSRPAPVRDGDMPEAEMLPGERRPAQPALAVRHLQPRHTGLSSPEPGGQPDPATHGDRLRAKAPSTADPDAWCVPSGVGCGRPPSWHPAENLVVTLRPGRGRVH